MAAKEDKKGFGSTVSKGSDEVFDICCDPCSTENLHLEAVGFCQSCSDYLCQTCYKCHSKLSATKSHKLLDKLSMPKTKVAVKVTDTLTVHCTKHPDKLLEYVCNEHDELGCVACMTLNHATCQYKSYVRDVSDNVIDNGCGKRLYAYLDHLVSMVTTLETETKVADRLNNGYQSECLARIKSWRKQIDEMLDKLQKKAEHNVMGLYQDNLDSINKTISGCQSINSEVQNTISTLRMKELDGKKNQLYVDIKLSTKRVSLLEGHIHDIKSLDMKRYEIGENKKLQELESTLSDMLALSVQQDGPVTKARYQKDINVKSDEDTEDCFINGISVLAGDRVVVTDSDNKAVKLIDVKYNKIVSRVAVAAAPFDVAQIELDKIAVTLINRTIVLMNVTDVLTTLKVIQVPNTNMYGICSYQDKLLVVCRDPVCLKVIDVSGKVIQTLDKNIEGDLLVATPSRIAMNSDQTLLYVTGHFDHTVTTMTMDGKIEHICKSDMLEFPVGVTVGRYGEVFVCSGETHTIHQLSPTGQYIRILLGMDENLASFPYAITHCYDDNTLYISSFGSKLEKYNYIKVFQLE